MGPASSSVNTGVVYQSRTSANSAAFLYIAFGSYALAKILTAIDPGACYLPSIFFPTCGAPIKIFLRFFVVTRLDCI
jgi:hypothetical protein